jgi:hypothetical protein
MKGLLSHPGPTAARLAVPDQPDNAEQIDYLRWLSQMQSDMAASLGGVMLQGALPIPIGSAPGGSARPLSSPGRVLGWSIHETSGTVAAVVRIWDGREAGSKPLGYVALAAGGVSNHWIGGGGISVTDALFVETLSGTVEGVLYLGGVD